LAESRSRRINVPLHQRPYAVKIVLGLGQRSLSLRYLRLSLLKLRLGLRHLRLVLLQLSLSLFHLRAGLLNFRRQRTFQQLRLCCRLLRAGAGLRDGVAGSALIRAQFVLIQNGDQVPGVHPLTVVHCQAHDAAGDLAAHHHLVAVHGAGKD